MRLHAVTSQMTVFSICIMFYYRCIVHNFFRYGYKSLNNTKEVWSRTREAGIPLVSTFKMPRNLPCSVNTLYEAYVVGNKQVSSGKI
jgi:hypothetical protein